MANELKEDTLSEEPKKRTLTCELSLTDDVSCMKCDEDCPDARSLQCGHLFCLECIMDEVKHSPSPEAVSCPVCRSITTVPAGGWEMLGKEVATQSGDTVDDVAKDADLSRNNGMNGGSQHDDDLPTYDIETVTSGKDDDEADKEVTGDNKEEEKGEEEEEVEEGDESTGPQTESKETKEAGPEDSKNITELTDVNLNEQEGDKQVAMCPTHQEPLVKNRCKSCRTIETRNKKMEKVVGNKVQVCDGLFQDINNLQTAIHTGMNRVKEEIQERSRFLIAEIQKLEQQELERLQEHRQQRIEKLRVFGQTLIEVAKGIRDEQAVVQDKVVGTEDSEFNESMKELRKACGKKIPQLDQKLKLIAFIAGKDDKLGEVFGKIDEKPKE